MKIPHWLILAMLLAIAGLGASYYKWQGLGFPLQPDQQSTAWTVQAQVRFNANGGPLKAELLLPRQTPGFSRLDEHFVSRDFGLDLDSDPDGRVAVWSKRRARGAGTLYYRASYFADNHDSELALARPTYPPVPDLGEPFATAMATLVDNARSHSADIASFTTAILRQIESSDPDREMALFLSDPRYRDDPVGLARTLLAGARIPSMRINGIILTNEESNADFIALLAVHNEQRWLVFDPRSGDEGWPEQFLWWWSGDKPPLNLNGGEVENLRISVRPNMIDTLQLAGQRAQQEGSRWYEFSLLNLPVQTQNLYEILLLVPIGALIIVILRNVVGIRSFGTFMPILIALAFRETRLLAGVMLFLIIVSIGLLLRFYLERLKLLLVPRLAAVLTIVVLLMAVISIFSHRLNLEVGLSVALFPMVIIAMVIERMSIAWEEAGPRSAMIDAAGSLAVAALAYLVMDLEQVRYLVVVFPELLLFALAVMIALGRYTGYRLSELWRFKPLVEH
ncbi:MAG: inactive transglutaminase family protein [Wenzhouxiangellaceae bacterium]